MAFKDFPNVLYVKVFNDGEKLQMGSMQLTQSSIELKHIRVLLYVKGDLVGTEQLQLKLYSDSLYSKELYSSDVITLSDSNWLGYLRFDFDNVNLNKNLIYYLACVPSNYIKTETSYLSLAHDYPLTKYANNPTSFRNTNLLFEVFGYA